MATAPPASLSSQAIGHEPTSAVSLSFLLGVFRIHSGRLLNPWGQDYLLFCFCILSSCGPTVCIKGRSGPASLLFKFFVTSPSLPQCLLTQLNGSWGQELSAHYQILGGNEAAVAIYSLKRRSELTASRRHFFLGRDPVAVLELSLWANTLFWSLGRVHEIFYSDQISHTFGYCAFLRNSPS